GKVNGLRVDHPDGLYDPKQYLQRLQEYFVLASARKVFDSRPEYQGHDWSEVEGLLRERIGQALGPPLTPRPSPQRGEGGSASPLAPLGRGVGGEGGAPLWPLYVVVEKILAAGEPLPQDWPVYGTSGYAFLNMVNGLFVDAGNAEAFTRLYQEWIMDYTPFAEVVYQKKFLILQIALSSELHMLAYQLDRLAQKNRWSRDFTLNRLRHALREVIACVPVYRSYISDEGVHEADRKYVLRAIKRAKAKNPALSQAHFSFVRDMLLLKYGGPARFEDQAEERRF